MACTITATDCNAVLKALEEVISLKGNNVTIGPSDIANRIHMNRVHVKGTLIKLTRLGIIERVPLGAWRYTYKVVYINGSKKTGYLQY